MSPLFLVGMLISLAAGDVKHVLEGQAHPPDANLVNPNDVNYLAHSGAGGGAYASSSSFASSGSFAGARSGSYAGAAGGSGNGDNNAFWWANTNSPFKHAYEQFKKCSLKGNCYPQQQVVDSKSGIQSVSDFVNSGLQSVAGIDVKKNPFLNGQFQGVAISSCSGTVCKNGKPQTVVTSCNGNDCKTSTVEGQKQQSGNGGSFSFAGGSVGQFDASKNPFLNGQFAGGNTVTSGNGAQVETKEGFLGVQPSQPFGNKNPFPTKYPEQSVNQGAQPFPVSAPGSNSNKQPFPSNRPSYASAGAFSGAFAGANGYEQQLKLGGVACQGSGYICVEKSQCLNGVVSSSAGVYQAGNREQFCNAEQVCCRLSSPSSAAAGFQSSAGAFASAHAGAYASSGKADLSDITAGKSSVPGSVIKFGGSAGLSPGSIQVLSEDNASLKPISSVNGVSSSSPKPVRDISLINAGSAGNSVFSSTVDYSNVNVDDNIRFASGIQGPAYLPPLPPSNIAESSGAPPTYVKIPQPTQQYTTTSTLPPPNQYLPPTDPGKQSETTTGNAYSQPPLSHLQTQPSTPKPPTFEPQGSPTSPTPETPSTYRPPFSYSSARPFPSVPPQGTTKNNQYLPPASTPSLPYQSPKPQCYDDNLPESENNPSELPPCRPQPTPQCYDSTKPTSPSNPPNLPPCLERPKCYDTSLPPSSSNPSNLPPCVFYGKPTTPAARCYDSSLPASSSNPPNLPACSQQPSSSLPTQPTFSSNRPSSTPSYSYKKPTAPQIQPQCYDSSKPESASNPSNLSPCFEETEATTQPNFPSSSFKPQSTPGYEYPKPTTPGFQPQCYDSSKPISSSNPDNLPPCFVRPTPQPTFPSYSSPSTNRPQPTPGYSYPTSSRPQCYDSSRPASQSNPSNLPPCSRPTPQPTSPSYSKPSVSPSPGYSYPKPSSPQPQCYDSSRPVSSNNPSDLPPCNEQVESVCYDSSRPASQSNPPNLPPCKGLTQQPSFPTYSRPQSSPQPTPGYSPTPSSPQPQCYDSSRSVSSSNPSNLPPCKGLTQKPSFPTYSRPQSSPQPTPGYSPSPTGSQPQCYDSSRPASASNPSDLPPCRGITQQPSFPTYSRPQSSPQPTPGYSPSPSGPQPQCYDSSKPASVSNPSNLPLCRGSTQQPSFPTYSRPQSSPQPTPGYSTYPSGPQPQCYDSSRPASPGNPSNLPACEKAEISQPRPSFPSYSRPEPTTPRPSFSSTPGYSYPKPSSPSSQPQCYDNTRPASQANPPNLPPCSRPTFPSYSRPEPTTSRPSSTPGYSYPEPSTPGQQPQCYDSSRPASSNNPSNLPPCESSAQSQCYDSSRPASPNNPSNLPACVKPSQPQISYPTTPRPSFPTFGSTPSRPTCYDSSKPASPSNPINLQPCPTYSRPTTPPRPQPTPGYSYPKPSTPSFEEEPTTSQQPQCYDSSKPISSNNSPSLPACSRPNLNRPTPGPQPSCYDSSKPTSENNLPNLPPCGGQQPQCYDTSRPASPSNPSNLPPCVRPSPQPSFPSYSRPSPSPLPTAPRPSCYDSSRPVSSSNPSNLPPCVRPTPQPSLPSYTRPEPSSSSRPTPGYTYPRPSSPGPQPQCYDSNKPVSSSNPSNLPPCVRPSSPPSQQQQLQCYDSSRPVSPSNPSDLPPCVRPSFPSYSRPEPTTPRPSYPSFGTTPGVSQPTCYDSSKPASPSNPISLPRCPGYAKPTTPSRPQTTSGYNYPKPSTPSFVEEPKPSCYDSSKPISSNNPANLPPCFGVSKPTPQPSFPSPSQPQPSCYDSSKPVSSNNPSDLPPCFAASRPTLRPSFPGSPQQLRPTCYDSSKPVSSSNPSNLPACYKSSPGPSQPQPTCFDSSKPISSSNPVELPPCFEPTKPTRPTYKPQCYDSSLPTSSSNSPNLPPCSGATPSGPSVTSYKPYSPTTPSFQYTRPSVTSTPSPTAGYEYKKPTPTLNYPQQPNLPSQGSDINNQYVRPRPRPTQPPFLRPSTNTSFATTPADSNIINISVIPHKPDKEPQPANPNEVRIPTTTRRPRPTPPRQQQGSFEQPVLRAACAAALKCVEESYCSAEGVISATPVALTREQQVARVPTTECTVAETGGAGVCCRDANYKDPWPSANLVNGVDDGQYREDPNLGQYNAARHQRRTIRSGERSEVSPFQQQLTQTQNLPSCGTRHYNTKPSGPEPLNVNFAEIPWQAMILRDSNRSLLCGGIIIRRDAVLTTAHCVDGLDTRDILIKGGEWKLGIDEEPLPFQIVKVAVVVRHPDYRPGVLQNDLAVLVLQEKLRFTKNVGSLCLPSPNQIPTQNCIATGWGKRILQLHLKGAIMRAVDVNVMEPAQCEETLQSKYQTLLPHYNQNTLCGYSDNDQCKVDYGSALACADSSGRYTLSGVFAWDTGCKDPAQIGGYIAPDVEWINQVLTTPVRQLRRLEASYNAQYSF